MQTTSRTFLDLSRIFYNHIAQKARLFEENPGTAKLLELAESNYLLLKGLDYEDFCNALAELADIRTRSSFSVEGKSANWITVYQFIHNGRTWSEFLLNLLEELEKIGKAEFYLPITPSGIESLKLDENIKQEFLEKFWEVFLFKKVLDSHRE